MSLAGYEKASGSGTEEDLVEKSGVFTSPKEKKIVDSTTIIESLISPTDKRPKAPKYDHIGVLGDW